MLATPAPAPFRFRFDALLVALLALVLVLESPAGSLFPAGFGPFATEWDSTDDETDGEEEVEVECVGTIRRLFVDGPASRFLSALPPDSTPGRSARSPSRLVPASPSGLGFRLRC